MLIMKKYKWAFLIMISFLFTNFLEAQNKKAENTTPKDTLIYLNGEKEIVSNYKFSEDGTILSYLNKKNKEKEVDIDYLFAIINADGSQQVVYKPSDNEEDTLTIKEMYFFVRGGQEAREHHKAKIAFVEGFVVGVASPFVVLATIGNPFYTPILPAINSTVVGLTKPSVKKIKLKYPELAKNKLFVEGFREAGRQKRVKHSIFGGVGGILTGILIIALL